MRRSGFATELVKVLPDHWREERLHDVAELRTSNVDKKSAEGETPVKLCNYVDVYYRDRITVDISFMEATATESQVEHFALKVGDVVITKDSESPNDIGIPSLIAESLPDLVCGYHLTIIRPDEQMLVGGYLFYALSSCLSAHQFYLAANGVTRFGLTYQGTKNIRIAVPTMPEQRQIAAFLDRKTGQIDALIAKKQLLIEKLKEKRLAVITQAVTKGLDSAAPLRDSRIPWLGFVPTHWETIKIKYAAKIESGHTPSRTVDEYWIDCTIPWVSLNDSKALREQDSIRETYYQISELGLANSSARLLPPGAVVFSRDATVGLCAITEVAMAVSQHFVAYVCGPGLNSKFLLLVLKAMNQHLQSLQTGSTIVTIGMPEVRSLTCPLPSLPEQCVIVKYVDEETRRIDAMLDKVDSAIARLAEYRTALITAATTGKIDLRGWQPDTVPK